MRSSKASSILLGPHGRSISDLGGDRIWINGLRLRLNLTLSNTGHYAWARKLQLKHLAISLKLQPNSDTTKAGNQENIKLLLILSFWERKSKAPILKTFCSTGNVPLMVTTVTINTVAGHAQQALSGYNLKWPFLAILFGNIWIEVNSKNSVSRYQNWAMTIGLLRLELLLHSNLESLLK